VVPGYRFEGLIGTDWIDEQPEVWMRRLAQLNAKVGIVNFINHPERDRYEQAAVQQPVIGRDGRILGRHRKVHPTPGSEGWLSAGEPGRPVPVDSLNGGLLICADAYNRPPALHLRDAGAQLLISTASWWPGEWGPNGEWEGERSTRVCR
jgi:5-aminopentanamidase